MFSFCFVLLFLFQQIFDGNCYENEEYRCDLPCEQSCSTLDLLVPCYGTKICGKFCKMGYVRESVDGTCVRPYECRTCSANETYAAVGRDCANCQNYQTAKCRNKHEKKCYCKHGYIRNERNQCIFPIDC
nr:uncharacterized protein LOC111421588 [Onthophagus taurus]